MSDSLLSRRVIRATTHPAQSPALLVTRPTSCRRVAVMTLGQGGKSALCKCLHISLPPTPARVLRGHRGGLGLVISRRPHSSWEA